MDHATSDRVFFTLLAVPDVAFYGVYMHFRVQDPHLYPFPGAMLSGVLWSPSSSTTVDPGVCKKVWD